MSLASDKPWALRPSDPARLTSMLSATMRLFEKAAPTTTLGQEASNWKYWTRWCTGWNTPPIRPHVRELSAADYQVEVAFWGAAIAEIHAEMPSRCGVVGEAKPQSALAVLRGVRRAHRRLQIETVPLTAAVQATDGILREYLEVHGPEALIPERKEPLANSMVHALIHMPNGTKLGQRVLDWSAPFFSSLRSIYSSLAQTGMRKSEVSLHESVTFGLQHLSLANVVWSIGERLISAPTPEDFANITSDDYALLRPPPCKSDQFSLHWGASTIYLRYSATDPICAARDLMHEELRRRVPEARRRHVPLFAMPDGKPWRHGILDRIFHAMMVVVVGPERAGRYSMHSWRIYLACALLAAGASDGTIQAMLRWRSDDALRIYARINDVDYADWLGKAAAARVSSVRTTSLHASVAEAVSDVAVPRGLDAAGRERAFQAHWQRAAAGAHDSATAGAGSVPVHTADATAASFGGGAGISAMLAQAERLDALGLDD